MNTDPYDWGPILAVYGDNQSAVARACQLSDTRASRPSVARYIRLRMRPKAEWVKGLVSGSRRKLSRRKVRPDLY